MEIKNRYTGKVIATGDTAKEAAQNNKVNLNGVDLSGADLSSANLSGADLSCADLRDADLSYANLRDVDLSDADLRGADLKDADLSGADLRDADLRDADYGNEALLKYFTTGPIGSRNDYLQVLITDKKTIVKTGCFSGTLEELSARTDRGDYKAIIPFIESMVALERCAALTVDCTNNRLAY